MRQAFMYAIDRKAIAETLWNNTAVVANCYFVNPDLVPADLNPYDYDPDKAKALLEEAGWDPGAVGEVELLTYYGDPLSMDILSAVQAQLSEVGINLKLRPVDVPTFVEEFYTEEPKWRLVFLGAATGPDPDVIYTILHSSAIWPNGNNIYNYQNAEFDTLMDAGRLESDPAKRAEIYQDVCRILNDDLPRAWMWETVRFGAVNKRIGDFIYTPSPGGGRYLAYPEKWYIK